MAFAVKFSTNHCLNSHDLLLPSVSSNPTSKISPVSSLSTRDAGHHMELKHPSRASAEGLQPAVFAALVPNSADKPLQELMERILADGRSTYLNISERKTDIEGLRLLSQ